MAICLNLLQDMVIFTNILLTITKIAEQTVLEKTQCHLKYDKMGGENY